MNAYVYQKITAYAALKRCVASLWPHLRGLQLADPNPDNNEPVQLLIGADRYGSLLMEGLRQGPINSPTAQLTVLGWIVSGPTGEKQSADAMSVINCVSAVSTDRLLKRFWEIEELPKKPHLTPDEIQCESHIRETHTRASDGRYVVRLPFRNGPPIDIGESVNIAQVLYSKLERRLANKPDILREYDNFLNEYETMGHMEEVRNTSSRYSPVYFRHHPVIREDSATTRLRIVFNASSVTSNGTSLNDHLLPGPKLQKDISAILLNWRQYRYVYIAEIAKMFRQILIHRDDTDFQRIVWRNNKTEPIQSYRLLTVTYGTAPAPYLSMRVLQQLTEDEGHDFPKAVHVLKNAIYVDDVLFGADEVETAKETRDQLNALMKLGGLHLRKWAANHRDLLRDIPVGDHELALDHDMDETDTLKVLGLTWLPSEDAFRYQVAAPPTNVKTKRAILSWISKLFDPLGWASPVIISAKILMQDLWLRKIGWDESVPEDVLQAWQTYCRDLPCLTEVRIPRWTGKASNNVALELHGFSDASERAYSAVVYLRVIHDSDNIQVTILAGKSKVAPLETVSIPRLELNGAVLLTRLLEFVQTTLHLEHIPIYGWIDSTAVLAWLTQHPSKWKTYVANRVSKIQTTLPHAKWQHIVSQQNPADCASRGISASELVHHSLWWKGPSWLQRPSTSWPLSKSSLEASSKTINNSIREETRGSTVCHANPRQDHWELCDQISSWPRLLRVTAYIQRFISNLRECRAKNQINVSALTVTDIATARKFWIRTVQQISFPNELKALHQHAPISRSSPLRALNPFLDANEIIRLGGRLRHAFLSYDERFPIILPRHRISELLIDHAHKRALHGGTQLTLRILRQNFWILGVRSLVKTHIHRCLPCVRERANTATQLMGHLPYARSNQSAPFSHCGIDYAGPFNIIPYVGRGQRSRKYYVALFVCLATRAIHLEYVDDYTTSGFLAAFKRFASRRGLPTDIYSDNGTNFHGAERELKQAFQAVCKNKDLKDILIKDGSNWHFIPSIAPHFGGLWEAGVKSFKHHFKRVVGAHTLSQLEFATLLCQIEACLNSRPITAIRDDPDDFSALTPGHFLIGRPLLAVPEPSLLDVPENRLSRWQRIQAMRDHIWRAWSHDYLHSLQHRPKWQRVVTELKVNELVLLKNILLPPAKWELARIISIHPGKDGHVRVATVKTANTTLKRPIAQLCRLCSE